MTTGGRLVWAANRGGQANLHYLGNLFNDPEAGVQLPAAVIVDVVQGEGGVIPADLDGQRGLSYLTFFRPCGRGCGIRAQSCAGAERCQPVTIRPFVLSPLRDRP